LGYWKFSTYFHLFHGACSRYNLVCLEIIKALWALFIFLFISLQLQSIYICEGVVQIALDFILFCS
jgi:hypothetical protein